MIIRSKLIFLNSEECVTLMEDIGFMDGSLRLENNVLWNGETVLVTLADTKNDCIRKLLCVREGEWRAIEVSAPKIETA